MKDPKFVHLRVHTAYSLAEGAIMMPKLIKTLCKMNMPAVAVTDSANMFGAKAFSKYFKLPEIDGEVRPKKKPKGSKTKSSDNPSQLSLFDNLTEDNND